MKTVLKVVPIDQRLSALQQRQNELRESVAKLKVGNDRTKTSQALLAAIDALNANPTDQLLGMQATKLVKQRLTRMTTRKTELDSDQRRDVNIILYFAKSSTVLQSLRADACAVLKLWGGDQAVTEVCQVFPGMRKLFED